MYDLSRSCWAVLEGLGASEYTRLGTQSSSFSIIFLIMSSSHNIFDLLKKRKTFGKRPPNENVLPFFHFSKMLTVLACVIGTSLVYHWRPLKR